MNVVEADSSFLEGPKAALTASKDFDDGLYKSVPQIGVRAFGRAYSAWAYGQTVRCLLIHGDSGADEYSSGSDNMVISMTEGNHRPHFAILRDTYIEQSLQILRPGFLPARRVGGWVPEWLGCERPTVST